VNAGDLANRGDFAGLGVAHLVPESDRFFADLEQHASNFDDISSQQFAPVGDILLNRSHATAGFPEESRRQPDPREQIPVGLVELADIPHDVHVADMVALPRIDRTAISGWGFHRSLPPCRIPAVSIR
jgi:hypothetical protein